MLSALSTLTLTAAITNAPALMGASSNANLVLTYGSSLVDGASAGQANVAWWSRRTLAASASEQLDLAGVLTDQFGAVITFARVKILVVSALPANTNNTVVGGAASNTFLFLGAAAHTAPVRPGETVMWSTGSADAVGHVVTAATGDILQVANSGAGTPITYDIAIIGTAT